MKKLLYFSTTLSLLFFTNCKKEAITTTPGLQEEIATGKPSAPSPSILQWQKTYGSASNEMGYAITNAFDGNGFIFTASALANGGDITGHHGGIGADVWVVKANSDRSFAWKKCIGGTNSDYADDIIATTDGGYVFAGWTKSNDGDVPGSHGGWDLWVVKLDGLGSIIWKKTFGGSGDENSPTPNSIIQTNDDGFLVASSTTSSDGDLVGLNHGSNDVWILKLSSNGDLLWQKTFGGSSGEGFSAITNTSDGNFMICGNTSSTDGDLLGQTNRGGTDVWLFKINNTGDLLWQKTIGGSQNEGADAILETPDGGFVFSGSTTSIDGDVVGNSSGNNAYFDTWVVKINNNGTIGWQKFFGGFDADNADIRDIDSDGNLVLTGYTFSKNGDIPASKGGEDLWILRLDGTGAKLYSNVFGGRGGDMSIDAIRTSDGSYISVGRSNSTNGDVTGNQGGEDVWLMKFKFQ